MSPYWGIEFETLSVNDVMAELPRLIKNTSHSFPAEGFQPWNQSNFKNNNSCYILNSHLPPVQLISAGYSSKSWLK